MWTPHKLMIKKYEAMFWTHLFINKPSGLLYLAHDTYDVDFGRGHPGCWIFIIIFFLTASLHQLLSEEKCFFELHWIISDILARKERNKNYSRACVRNILVWFPIVRILSRHTKIKADNYTQERWLKKKNQSGGSLQLMLIDHFCWSCTGRHFSLDGRTS